MRLLDVGSLQIHQFQANPPPYAILSHVWSSDEVTFQDLSQAGCTQKNGFKKISSFCWTLTQNLPRVTYAWVDTCCIDKTSSSELSEAINSMCAWYRGAVTCYAHLADVKLNNRQSLGSDFEKSTWFTRGWTLQELLAPVEVEFYDKNWKFIGTRLTLAKRIASITGIDEDVLVTGNWTNLSAAHKMSWAAKRRTTRPEDMAYCLLGIFDVNMPMLYGEGERAFTRLQEEILREYDDLSLLAWDASDVPASEDIVGVLASHPRFFQSCAGITSYPSEGKPFAITNRGLQVSLPIFEGPLLGAALPCAPKGNFASSIMICVVRDAVVPNKYSRHRSVTWEFLMAEPEGLRKVERDILLVKRSIFGIQQFARCWVRYSGPLRLLAVYSVEKWQFNGAGNWTMIIPKPSTGHPVVSVFAFQQVVHKRHLAAIIWVDARTGLPKINVVGISDVRSDVPFNDVQVQDQLKKLAAVQTDYLDKSTNDFRLQGMRVRAQLSREIIRGSWTTMVNLICS
ncbi:ankyrin repeat-containing protein [Pochonia chlamydosporia 170]|uniref:Ankyrin repeat-containing protein n=1 Tax=Pochonia chlamydosporia 170 TaxID=1380566 RepID=A0A179FAR6_METCM|nr:ankyrin repeat-containing protein [Pochonia chlamydosporia 170]OAQ62625.1 ankyrin repeat-containing protein [Pochonia chlamydosporia 170]